MCHVGLPPGFVSELPCPVLAGLQRPLKRTPAASERHLNPGIHGGTLNRKVFLQQMF